MKKVQLPRFKDHIGLGEKPKLKSYFLRMHEEDANNGEDDNFESKPNHICVERRVLPHPKKRMHYFMENDETSNDELNESTNTTMNNTCAMSQCPSAVANSNVGYRDDRLEGMGEIARLPYPQTLSQISVNFATTNCDLDSLQHIKLHKEYKPRNGYGVGCTGSPYSSHSISSSKVPSSIGSRQRTEFHYSVGKSLGKIIKEDRLSVQNTPTNNNNNNNPRFDCNPHSMNLQPVNPWMCSDNTTLQQTNECEEKLLAELQYSPKILGDYILDRNEHHSQVNPSIDRYPEPKYFLHESPRREMEMLGPSSSPPPRGPSSAEDLRLPNSSRRLAQIINEVSCGKQAVLRQLVPLKAANPQPPVGDPLARRRSGYQEQELWQNRKDANLPHCDANFNMDGFHPQGLPFPQYQRVPIPIHGEDTPFYPPHHSAHVGYSAPLQYTSYEQEDVKTRSTGAGAPPSLSARDKTISWLSSGDSSSFAPYKPTDEAPSITSQSTSSSKKSDDYRSRPMSTWEFRHVAHFLIEATHDLGIQYEDTDFSQLSKVNGRKLIAMEPEHFEKFAASQGERIFEYVRRHRNHEVLTDGAFENFMESSPSDRSIETPRVNYNAPTWSAVTDDPYAYYPPMDSLSVENGFSNTKSSPQPNQVPSPYSSMSMDAMPTTSTFSGQAPFQYQADTSPSVNSVEHQPHSNLQQPPYPSVPLMSSGSSHTATTTDNKTSYHSSAQRQPQGSSGSQQEKSTLHDSNRPSSGMSTTVSEIEESSDDDEEDDGEGDDEEEEEEEEEIEEKVIEEKPPEPPKKRGPGRPPKPENERKKKKKTGRLWEFIRNLLLNPETCPSIVKWEDPETGVFRFVQSEKVAEKWGMRKNNKKMNYEKLSRAMRYYYKGKVFEPVLGRRLVYKFGANAKGWKPNQGNFGE